jgi:hypothetical protein
VRERLDRVRDCVVVLGRAQGLERLARVALGRRRLSLLGEEPRLRPVEAGARVRVGDVAADRERLRNDALGSAEIAAVGQRVARHRGEAHVLEHVRRALVDVEAALEQGDRGTQLTGRRVRTGEAFGDPRVLDRVEATGLDRGFEAFDRVARLPLVEGDVAQARERLRPLGGGDCGHERVLVEPPGALEVVEAQRELRLEER